MPSHAWPRILSDHLVPVPEPLAAVLRPGDVAPAAAVASRAARALLDLASLEAAEWPPWLAPHQVPAARRLAAILARYGGAVLADAVGLGKSYVALAVALALREPFVLVVPAVLVPQWRALLQTFVAEAPIITHESLSTHPYRPLPPSTAPYRLFVIDEAHRFRNPETNRYRALAQLAVGARCLLVTATPVHNRVADLFHLFRLFARDHALAALGVPSLRRAACGAIEPQLAARVAARLVVARSRDRVRGAYPVRLSFPTRAPGEVVRVSVAPSELITELAAGVAGLGAPGGGGAAPLLRLLLLRRLASSIAAFRSSLARHEAFLSLALEAARQGRALSPGDFQRLFPRAETADLQLVLFPMVLEPGPGAALEEELDLVRRLAAGAVSPCDPKAEALEALLDRGGKTIVFTEARATARHLLRRLRGCGRRVALVAGAGGGFAAGEASRAEVLRAFAPVAQGANPPPLALETDVLIATDLLSEGLNLQDAARVIHYDLPWSPARLAQRVGRIDRLGSPHRRIETVSFMPPEPLAGALALEERLAAKARAQVAIGAAQVETPQGADSRLPALDWCDRLEVLAGASVAPERALAAVRGEQHAVVLVVRVGALVEALVVTDAGAVADPEQATALLEAGARAEPRAADRGAVEGAVRTASPLVRARVAAVQDARWRAADRDRLARRLIPWVLTAARRAARRGARDELTALDALVSRLALGMTAGEELSLEELLARRAPLGVRELLRWHERLPPVEPQDQAPVVELVAALVVGS